MNTVAIMQPTYLPWLGYMDMLDQADLFVLLDVVEVSHQSWQTRNRVLAQGAESWLSVPVHAHQGQRLMDVQIDNTKPWRRKHSRTLQGLAAGSPHLDNLLVLYERPWVSLVEFTTAMIRELCLILGITTPTVRASEYGLPQRTNPVDRLAELLEQTGASEFLTAAGSSDYLASDWLPVGGNPNWVRVRFHEYEPQPYEQGGPFVSHLSVVDALARLGPEQTLDLVRSGRMLSEAKI